MVSLNTQMKRHDVYEQIKCILKTDEKKGCSIFTQNEIRKEMICLR